MRPCQRRRSAGIKGLHPKGRNGRGGALRACQAGGLEVRSLAPDRVALPISETGYRSAFPPAATVTAMGGRLSYVRSWLDNAAQSPEWRDRQEAARQLSFL